MVMKEEQERVRTLIADTVTLLCRNGLTYKSKFCINALIGITLDENDVFLLDIRETIKTAEDANSCDDNSLLSDETTPKKSTRKRQKRKRGAEKSKQVEAKDSGSEEVVDSDNDNSSNTFSEKIIKQETEDDDSEDLVFIKDEPGTQTVSSYTGPMGDEHSLTQQEQPLLGEDSLETISPQQGALFGTSTLAPDTSAGPSSWSHQTPFPQIVQSTSTSDLKPKQENPGDAFEEHSTPMVENLDDELEQQFVQENTDGADHLVKTLDFKCSLCGKSFTRNDSLKRHYRIHTGNTFKCDLCGKGFTNKYNLKQHFDVHHLQKKHSCGQCEKVFISKRGLQLHEREHQGKFQYLCVYCGKGFNIKNHYKCHINIHRGIKPFKCSKNCGKSFRSTSNRRDHEMICGTPKEPKQCAQCGKIFSNERNLISHMKLMHKNPEDSQENK